MSNAVTEAMIEAYRKAKANAQEWCGCCDSDENRHYIVKGNDILWEYVSDDYVAGHSLMMTELQRLRDASALSAALSAGQEQPVAIKPLEWEYAERKTMTYTAFWADGDVAYYIDQSFGSDSYYFRTIRWPEETIYDGDDLPSAKAAAQKDYETRILSALEVSHAS